MTGCVYSKFSNFVVTAGTDCAGMFDAKAFCVIFHAYFTTFRFLCFRVVNVWSSNGGCLHSFCSHSKVNFGCIFGVDNLNH